MKHGANIATVTALIYKLKNNFFNFGIRGISTMKQYLIIGKSGTYEFFLTKGGEYTTAEFIRRGLPNSSYYNCEGDAKAVAMRYNNKNKKCSYEPILAASI